jgi:hypothetical protein
MRTRLIVLTALLTTGFALSAAAELQDVDVGGSLRIRANWFSENGLTFTDDAPDSFFVEQRTRVNVKATFSDDITAFIELDSYNVFGDDFRGLERIEDAYAMPPPPGVASPTFGTLTAIDNGDGTPVSFYQGYIDIQGLWGSRFNARVGRQEIQLGSEFLVGNNDTSSRFRGLSFDGLTLSSQWGDFLIRSWYTELVNNNNPFAFEDSSDIWFHGLYVTYTGFEDMTLDAYTMRYYQALTSPLVPLGFVESIDFVTLGLRFAGAKRQFDWDLEGAYQFGDSGLAAPMDDIGAFALTGKAGYTFDVEYQPRVFLNGTYLSGDDQDPAFNRLFSDHEYSEFLDATDLSNVWIVGGGVGAQMTESIGLTLAANYFNAVESAGASSSELGFEVALYATYQ